MKAASTTTNRLGLPTMLKRLSVLPLLLAVAACADNTAPQVEGMSLAKGGRWATGKTTTAETSAATTEKTADGTAATLGCPCDDVLAGVHCMLRHEAGAPGHLTLDTSFVAVQGQATKFDLWYDDGSANSVANWFATIQIPRTAQLLDETGLALSKGERVDISVKIDPDGKFLVHLGPHGSVFPGRHPATIRFNLKYADLGKGAFEGSQVWYQAQEGDEWGALESTLDIQAFWIEATIQHFSNYAVAW